MKHCSVCSVEKPIESFNWRDKAKGWHRPECRDCQKAEYAKAKAKDPQQHNAAAQERKRKWRVSGGGKRWYAKHRAEERLRTLAKYYRDRTRIRAELRTKYAAD